MSRPNLNPPGPARKAESALRRATEILRGVPAALGPFGYRPVDAEFLASAALLGGYFLRRQYRAFAGCHRGGAEVALLRRAERNRHVARVVGKTLYRLQGASLYRALGFGRGRASVRARRAVKQRLLSLDYFIEWGHEGRWLLTARDKAAYFASLSVPNDRFPVSARKRAGKPRVFSDGFPIKIEDSDPPIVAFSYAHAGATEGGMAGHMRRHAAFARALAGLGFVCEWVVLADSPVQFRRLRQAWRRWSDRLERDWAEREYFELRRTVEKRRWYSLSRDSVERYALLRSALRTDATKRRYRKWLEIGAPERGACLASSCSYREVLLDLDYSAADAIARKG